MVVKVDSENNRPHILYIDDEEVLVDIGKQRLQSLGYGFSGHCSSREALDAFAAAPHRYDAVITDLAMPDINGVELAKKLTAIRPDIPIILYTADPAAFSDQEISAAGIDWVVLKPLSTKDFAALINNILCA